MRLVVAGLAHELVGVDGQGQLCVCGVKDPAFVEHVADVLTVAFGVSRYWARRKARGRSAVPEAPRYVLKEAA